MSNVRKRIGAEARRRSPASAGSAADDETIPVQDENGHWQSVKGGPGSGDIFDDPFATFTEWNSEEDQKAFDKL